MADSEGYDPELDGDPLSPSSSPLTSPSHNNATNEAPSHNVEAIPVLSLGDSELNRGRKRARAISPATEAMPPPPRSRPSTAPGAKPLASARSPSPLSNPDLQHAIMLYRDKHNPTWQTIMSDVKKFIKDECTEAAALDGTESEDEKARLDKHVDIALECITISSVYSAYTWAKARNKGANASNTTGADNSDLLDDNRDDDVEAVDPAGIFKLYVSRARAESVAKGDLSRAWSGPEDRVLEASIGAARGNLWEQVAAGMAQGEGGAYGRRTAEECKRRAERLGMTLTK